MYFSGHNHEFCEECGLCIECGDCKELGCGKLKLIEKASKVVLKEDKKLLEELGKK